MEKMQAKENRAEHAHRTVCAIHGCRQPQTSREGYTQTTTQETWRKQACGQQRTHTPWKHARWNAWRKVPSHETEKMKGKIRCEDNVGSYKEKNIARNLKYEFSENSEETRQ